MTASSESLPGVGRTALGVAGLRAMESRRPDRLFDDPYAQAFVEAGRAFFPEVPDSAKEKSVGALFYAHVVVRTRFYDEYLLRAVAAGCEQVVLLASGLDTRAFRLTWPDGVRLFELDLPEVLEFKERVLAAESAAPGCVREAIPADLREDWSALLLAAGFRYDAPTAWLVEGLLIYLSHDEATRLLTTVGELSAPGSRVSFERRTNNRNGLAARVRAMPSASRLTTLWKGGLGSEGPAWLAEHGWQTELHVQSVLAVEYGRSAAEFSDGGFVTAVRS
jgi:methyltransferase (TIGR00027 family)